MSCEIYIRPLRESDADISYQWRNDSEVWKYTGSKPDKEITREIEKQWIQKVLLRPDEKRFAICLKENDEYIGNVQLTGIDDYEAEFHIFIGEKKYWGKGIGTVATNLIVEYAFNELKLQCVYLIVKKENIAAVRAYEKAGFIKIIENEDGSIYLSKYSIDKVENKLVSVFMMAYNHENFISQAIDGILMQKTAFNIEIVIGEDKSTDNTRNILLDYARKYPDKLKLILHKKNVGASKNQLSVFNACKSRYMAICEGDDYWTNPLKLQKQIDFLESNPDFAICFHNVTVEYEGDTSQPHLLHRDKFQEVTTFEDLAKENYIPTLSCVFRNHLDKTLPEWYFEMPIGDWILNLLNAQYGKIKYFDEVMGVYRVHGKGTWGNKPIEKRLLDLIKVIENCRKHFYPRGDQEFRQALKDVYRQLSLSLFPLFESGDYKNFRFYYKKIAKSYSNIPPRTFTALTVRYALSYIPFLRDSYKTAKIKQ